MTDLIKKEDAIKAINLRARIPHDVVSAQYTSMAINAICSVPSADRTQGEWIGGDVPTRCSICGHYWDEYVEGREIWYGGSVPNFCPNCGARMKGADDETD